MIKVEEFISALEEMHKTMLSKHIQNNYSHLNANKSLNLAKLVRASMNEAKRRGEPIAEMVVPEEYVNESADYVKFIRDVLYFQGYDILVDDNTLKIDVSNCEFKVEM